MQVTISTIAEILGGLGIFFFALQFLSQNLKQLASQRLRQGIAKLTDHTGGGLLVGAVMITITQSGPASVFLLVGLVRAGMVSLKQAQPVLLGVNMAAGLTVLFLALEIHVAVMILIAISGVSYVYGNTRVKRIASAAIGVGFLFLGLEIMRDGASAVEGQPWFTATIAFAQGKPVLSFFVGAILTIVTQSSMAVVVVMTTLFGASSIGQSEALMFIYGANVGASVLTYFLSSGVTGIARQVAMYQVGYNFVAAAIMVPLFFAETILHIPLAADLVSRITSDPSKAAALHYIFFNLAPVPLLLLFLKKTAQILRLLNPETTAEIGSKPAYLEGRLPDDSGIAFRLIALEQKRMIDLLIGALENFRSRSSEKELNETLQGFDTLANTVRAAIEDSTERADLDTDIYNHLDNVMRIQNSLEAARQTIEKLIAELKALRNSERGLSFPVTATEGLDTIFHLLADVAQERDPEDVEILSQMTSEKGNGIRSVRAAYLTNEGALHTSDRVHLLAAANHCERLIWFTGEACEAYGDLKL